MNKLTQAIAEFRRHRVAVPLFLLAILSMIVLPLPPFVLDILFTFNIVLALIVVLVSVTARRPLDFSVFPTVILGTTLMRLSLNVASTRVVLLNGHTGTGAAGRVIEDFGHVVIGDNFVVGLVVFIILMIINFVVVTKGAERISEVSARFTLDALPGKQMAIDADPQRRPHQPGEGAEPPPRSGRRGRLLRRHGRRVQIRARRCDRRHPGAAHQHDRRRGDRRHHARSVLRGCVPALRAVDDRRRPGGADPRVAAVLGGGHHRHPHQCLGRLRKAGRLADAGLAHGALQRRGHDVRARCDPRHAVDDFCAVRRRARLCRLAHEPQSAGSGTGHRRHSDRPRRGTADGARVARPALRRAAVGIGGIQVDRFDRSGPRGRRSPSGSWACARRSANPWVCCCRRSHCGTTCP